MRDLPPITQKYVHYGNGKTYSYIGDALPLRDQDDSKVSEAMAMTKVLHTEEEIEVAIFIDYRGDMYADHKDTLAIYTNEEGERFGRPSSMFFGNVKDKGGSFVKRFTKA